MVLDSQKIIWVDDPGHRHQNTQCIIYDTLGTRGLTEFLMTTVQNMNRVVLGKQYEAMNIVIGGPHAL